MDTGEGPIQRVEGSIHDHPAMWIGVIIGGVALVIAWKTYQSNVANGAAMSASMPVNNPMPDYSTSGNVPGGYGADYGYGQNINAELSAILAYLQNANTPNPPVTTPPPASGSGSGNGGFDNGGNPLKSLFGTIRARFSLPGTKAYDTKNPGGVPFDLTPGAYESGGFIPFGKQLQITGPAVQGPSNLGNSTWFPVMYNGKSGFVSALDLGRFTSQVK